VGVEQRQLGRSPHRPGSVGGDRPVEDAVDGVAQRADRILILVVDREAVRDDVARAQGVEIEIPLIV
jgi:hypothetical protein